MKKRIFYFLITLLIATSINGQLAAVKMIGKNSGNSSIGFGVFDFWEISLGETGNKNLMIELLDFSFFPQKDDNIDCVIGYLSVKVGYKYIFSVESTTGFYVEPSAGYCRVVNSEGPEGSFGDGVAVAGEVGYTVEVGQRNNHLNFGLKYERDMAGTNTTVSSIGLRFSYTFHLFRRRRDY